MGEKFPDVVVVRGVHTNQLIETTGSVTSAGIRIAAGNEMSAYLKVSGTTPQVSVTAQFSAEKDTGAVAPEDDVNWATLDGGDLVIKNNFAGTDWTLYPISNSRVAFWIRFIATGSGSNGADTQLSMKLAERGRLAESALT